MFLEGFHLLLLSVAVSSWKISAWDDVNGPNHDGIYQNAKGGNAGLFEGDVRLTERDIPLIDHAHVKRDARIGDEYKWKSTTIPYEFDFSLNNEARDAIEAAFREYKNKSCITFRTKTSLDENYIKFVSKQGCNSYVGMIGGKQEISLGPGCEFKIVAIHEVLHALGFWHEQSRPDRDKYVNIIWQNIEPGMEVNFHKYSSTSYNHPYDYDSVMHYQRIAFSKNEKPTIESKSHPQRNFGQKRDGGLSEIDAAQLNAHYCDAKPKVIDKLVKSCERPPDECVDKLPFCAIASAGFCRLCWIKLNCALSCAKPDTRWECKVWATAGYCTDSRYKKFIKSTCPASCGLSHCVRKDDQNFHAL